MVRPFERPEVLFGGFVPSAVDRVGRWGDGFLGAGPLEYAERTFRLAEASWREHGRPGRPRLVGQVNAAIGPDQVVEQARTAITTYYGQSYFADPTASTPAGIRAAISSSATSAPRRWSCTAGPPTSARSTGWPTSSPERKARAATQIVQVSRPVSSPWRLGGLLCAASASCARARSS